MRWLLDPVGWAFLASIGAGMLLVAALVRPRIRSGVGERGRLFSVAVFPAAVALLGVAGAAQTLLSPMHEASVARRLPGLVRPVSSAAVADPLDEDEPSLAGDGGMILTEQQYLLATHQADALPAPDAPGAAAQIASAAGVSAPSRGVPAIASPPMLLAGLAGLVDARGGSQPGVDNLAETLKTGATSADAAAAPISSAAAKVAGVGAAIVPDARIVPAGSFTDFSPATSAASPAPEPATWLTMILGFGLCGCVLRRVRVGSTGIHGA